VLLAVTGMLIMFYTHRAETIWMYYSFNIFIVSVVVIVLWVFAKFILNKPFINHSLGMGDIVFFYAISLGFTSQDFILYFVLSILFTLVLTLALKMLNRSENHTIPLAGYMSVFYAFVILFSLFEY